MRKVFKVFQYFKRHDFIQRTNHGSSGKSYRDCGGSISSNRNYYASYSDSDRMKLQTIKDTLDLVIFALTIFLVLSGLYQGFNLLELSTNLVYFAALLAKMIVDLWEDRKQRLNSH